MAVKDFIRKRKSKKLRKQADKEPPIKKITGPKARKKTKTRFGVGPLKTINGKANVSAEQLKKTGLSLRQYMNTWNKTGKRPTAKVTTGPRAGDTSRQPVRAGRVTRGPRAGDTSRQPVIAGRVTRGPKAGDTRSQLVMARKGSRAGDTSRQPVIVGRVTRGPRAGDTSRQPVISGSIRDAREARSPQAQFRKKMRTSLRKRQAARLARGGVFKGQF